MNKITSFVVEDNSNALEMLINDLETNFENIKVIGKATGVIDAAKKLQNLKPDILFLDIMLGDGTAFDILEIVPSLKSKIIFITASEEYAVKAFKFAAVDYILKPYSIKDLRNSIKKAKVNISPKEEQLGLLNQLVKYPDKLPSKITLHTTESILVVPINEIVRCQSDNNYTTFYLIDKTKVLVSKTLKYYTSLLNNHGFVRIHQSHLINKNFIKEYIKSDGGYLVLLDKTNIPVSTRKRQEILKILKDL